MESSVDGVLVEQTELGYGVLAIRSFQVDDVIGEVQGEWIDDPDYSSDYCIDMGGDFSLEPRAPYRFLNHSCEPNCEFISWAKVDGEKESVWLCATRQIQAGEPLTIDYCWPAETAIRCLCGSPRCRGWIVDPDELDQLPLAT